MSKIGCPSRSIGMVWRFNDGMQARAQNDGEFSELLQVVNGVKRGYVMAPTLFSMFSVVLFR